MPPTYLDEYRRKKADQSRSQQSTGNVPPNADETLPNDQAGAPTDGVRPVRHVASRLTGLLDDSAPIGPDEPTDPYMDALIEGGQGDAQDASNEVSQTAGGDSPPPDAGSSEVSIPDDEFFETQANSAPQTPGRTPTALGSASIEPPARRKRNGRSSERAASADRRADDQSQPRPARAKTIKRAGAAAAVVAVAGLGVLLLTGAFTSSPNRSHSQDAAITAWLAGPQQVLDVLASKTSASLRASTTDLAAHPARPHKPRARHHAAQHNQHHRQARSRPAEPVAVSAPATTTPANASYVTSSSSNTPSATSYHTPASSTGSTSESPSPTTTASTPSPTQSGGSSSSTSSASHGSSAKQPAFGASGALGPIAVRAEAARAGRQARPGRWRWTERASIRWLATRATTPGMRAVGLPPRRA